MSLKPKNPTHTSKKASHMSLEELEAMLFPKFKSDEEYKAWKQKEIEAALEEAKKGGGISREEMQLQIANITEAWRKQH